jgi:hypothetical protein
MTWRVEYQDADGTWCLFNKKNSEAEARQMASTAFLQTRYKSIRVRRVV